MSNYTEDDKKKALQSAIYYLSEQEPFYGALLQELVIKYSGAVPTAGVTFNTKLQQYEVYINPEFFLFITGQERVATFHHEVLHFTNKHLFRLPFLDTKVNNEEKKLYNIAGDMAINQYIKGLPEGCVDVAKWKLDNGEPFPTFQSMEHYHELIKKENDKQKGNKNTKGNVPEQLEKFKDFDTHFWDSLDEETKQKMLDEAKRVLKRTVEKTSYSHTNVPDSIKDLLEEIDSLSASINYKQILKNVIKKTVSHAERESTWHKPNRKYGAYAPGTKVGNLPNLNIYIDTSGSISHTELNCFLSIMSEFLKVGTRQCHLGLWHTNLYYKKRYKLKTELDKSSVEAGGTDVTCVLEDIKKSKPNLSIILTDGYYDNANVKPLDEVLWIISGGGNMNHPMKHVGKTIELDKLK